MKDETARMYEQENEMDNDKTARDIWNEWAEKVEAHGHSLSDVMWEFLDSDPRYDCEYEDKGLETIDSGGVTGDFEEFLAENYSKPFNEYEALIAAIRSAVEGKIKFAPAQPEYAELVHKLATFCVHQKNAMPTAQTDEYANMGLAELQAEYDEMAQ